ncbi:hypothetical protein M0813_01735 [Anaeramoeba flamelloides]|uniref:Plus3 domain-containing protein n=1 Tax=Anaeramoeba flamelloides TaxID=1746091 RepID=A0ABQ8YWZ3_9EUKA|nr:hypothetical protein M0813_01735 [Anaeramoeba flamelloides]
MSFSHKRTFDQLEPLVTENAVNYNKHNSQEKENESHKNENKRKRTNNSQEKKPQQTPLGPISYQFDLLPKMTKLIGKELSLTLSQKLIEIYVPHSFANRNNQGIIKRKVFGSGKYLIRSDVFAIAVHSGKFTPEEANTEGLGIFLTLKFHYGTYYTPELSQRNGIRPMFAPQQKGLMVTVENCKPVKSMKQISSLLSIDQIEKQLIQLDNRLKNIPDKRLDKENEMEIKNNIKNEMEKEKEKDKIKEIFIEIKEKVANQSQNKNFLNNDNKPLFNNSILQKKKKQIRITSLHKICFSLSNDPCLSYNFDEIFRNKLFEHLLTQVLYLETSNQRYELSRISKKTYQLARVKTPLAQPQRRMIFEKNIPFDQKNIEIIQKNLKPDQICFGKKNSQFGNFKIIPKKFFFMKILKHSHLHLH